MDETQGWPLAASSRPGKKTARWVLATKKGPEIRPATKSEVRMDEGERPSYALVRDEQASRQLSEGVQFDDRPTGQPALHYVSVADGCLEAAEFRGRWSCTPERARC